MRCIVPLDTRPVGRNPRLTEVGAERLGAAGRSPWRSAKPFHDGRASPGPRRRSAPGGSTPRATGRRCPGRRNTRPSPRRRSPAGPGRSPASRGSRRSSSAGCPATRPSASPRAPGPGRGGLRVNGMMLKRRLAASSTLRQHRLVVADDDQLEARGEGEVVLPHEAGGDLVAAGQLLDPGLGPGPAFLGLRGRDEARAAQHGEVGRSACRAPRPRRRPWRRSRRSRRGCRSGC